MRKKIQILRVAEGSEHTAEIGGNVLHDEGKSHVFLLSRCRENKIAERQECQKCHIIGNQHRSDEGDVNQCQNGGTGIACQGHNSARQDGEKFDVAQSADNSQGAEKAGQRFEIGILQILRIGGNDAGGDGSQCQCNTKNSVCTDKCGALADNGIQQMMVVIMMMLTAKCQIHAVYVYPLSLKK